MRLMLVLVLVLVLVPCEQETGSILFIRFPGWNGIVRLYLATSIGIVKLFGSNLLFASFFTPFSFRTTPKWQSSDV